MFIVSFCRVVVILPLYVPLNFWITCKKVYLSEGNLCRWIFYFPLWRAITACVFPKDIRFLACDNSHVQTIGAGADLMLNGCTLTQWVILQWWLYFCCYIDIEAKHITYRKMWKNGRLCFSGKDLNSCTSYNKVKPKM